MFKPVQEYKIAVTGTASAALAIPEIASLYARGFKPQLLFFAKSCDIVKKTGEDQFVTAATAAATSTRDAGNNIIPEGAVMGEGVLQDVTHISAISDDGASTGTLYVTVGYGEEI